VELTRLVRITIYAVFFVIGIMLVGAVIVTAQSGASKTAMQVSDNSAAIQTALANTFHALLGICGMFLVIMGMVIAGMKQGADRALDQEKARAEIVATVQTVAQSMKDHHDRPHIWDPAVRHEFMLRETCETSMRETNKTLERIESLVNKLDSKFDIERDALRKRPGGAA
jgi:hypothetical protein